MGERTCARGTIEGGLDGPLRAPPRFGEPSGSRGWGPAPRRRPLEPTAPAKPALGAGYCDRLLAGGRVILPLCYQLCRRDHRGYGAVVVLLPAESSARRRRGPSARRRRFEKPRPREVGRRRQEIPASTLESPPE